MRACKFSEQFSQIIFSLLVAMSLFAGLASRSALACTCAVPSLETRYEKSDNVFTALITGGEVTREHVLDSPKLKTHFKVTEVFKGAIPFESFNSHVGGASCGISLQVGVEYLVFAPDSGEIGLCSGVMALHGESERPVEEGARYVDALRAFKSGETESLVEPWQFVEHQGICSLSGRFPYGDMRLPASVYVTYWARLPDNVVATPDKPYLKAGFTQMTIWVPGRDDLTDFPLRLEVGGRSYIAQWRDVQYSSAAYIVDSEVVHDLLANLVEAQEIRVKSAHPKYGDIDTLASTVNAGESVKKMHECITNQPD